MPKSCCVPGCTANKNKNPDRNFYTLPIDVFRREKWLAAINRAELKDDGTVNKDKLWSPKSVSTYVCSAHFISGKKVNDQCHPDYVPTLHLQKREVNGFDDDGAKLSRYERALKRKSTDKLDIHPVKRIDNQVKSTENFQHNDHSYTSSKQHEILEVDTSYTVDNTTINSNDTIDSLRELDVNNSKNTTAMQKPIESSEREMLYQELYSLRKERDIALENVSALEKIVDSGGLNSSSVEGNEEACQMMVGISWSVFLKVLYFLTAFLPSRSSSISYKEQLFLTLVKLRHNPSFEFLAHIKKIPKSTMIDYFWKWIDLMFAKLRFMIKWADRDVILKTIPPVFKQKFPRLTSIIDCFEIFIEAPRKHLARAKCFSSYKRHTTVKYFISCSPLGAINFISSGWGGRASDVHIVRESNFISKEYHYPGDQILADRGFTLHDDFASVCSAELITPAFTKGKKQLSAKEVEISRKISNVRIHIERIIGLLKNRYTIMKGVMPIRCVQRLKDESSQTQYSSCDKIIHVCGILINLGPSIIFKGEKEE